MKHKNFYLTFILFFSIALTITRAQCTLGNFPPTYTNTQLVSGNYFMGSKYTLTSPMYVTGLGFKGEGTGAKIQMALYKDANYAVGDFVAITGTTTVGSGNITLNVLTPTTIPAGDYYIMYNTDTTGYHIAASDYQGFNSGFNYVPFGSAPPTNTLMWQPVAQRYDRNVWAVSEVALPSSTSICSGQSFTLEAAGAASYTWSNGANSPSIVVSPSVTSTYSLLSSGTSSCNATAVTVSVYPYPMVTMSVSNSTVCFGSTISFSASGANDYLYIQNGFPINSNTVLPYNSQTYSVVGTSNGCSTTATLAVTVNTVPAAVVTGDNWACAGSSTTLEAYGADTYTWSHVGSTSYSATFIPYGNIPYSLTSMASNGCTSVLSGTVYALALPQVYVTGQTSVCVGNTVTLNASGAFSYSWSTGNSVPSIQVTPSVTTVYTLTGTDQYSGCKKSVTKTVTGQALPHLTIAGLSTLCLGDASILTVSGATTYSWNTGPISPSISVSPAITTTYSVSGTDQYGCMSNATRTVVVNALPTLTLSGGNFVCEGASISQLGSGSAISYSWSNGYIGNPVSLSPSVTTLYTLTATDVNSCKTALTKLITVNALPIITAHSSSAQICAGEAAIVYASGGTSYAWSAGLTNNVPFYPTANAVYTVTGTASNACQNTATVAILVKAIPVISISATHTLVCKNELLSIFVAGAQSYTWNTGDTASSVSFPLINDQLFTVSGLSSDGCHATGSIQIQVSECTQLAEVSDKLSVGVYPNPTTGSLFVNTSSFSQTLGFDLYNNLGQLLLTVEKTEPLTEIDLESFPNGIYTLVLNEQGKQLKAVKVVKQN